MGNMSHVSKKAVASFISPKHLFGGKFEAAVVYQRKYEPVRSTITSMCLHFDAWCLSGFNHRGRSNMTQTSLLNIPSFVIQVCFSLWKGSFLITTLVLISAIYLHLPFWGGYEKPMTSSLFPKSMPRSLIESESY